MLEVGCGRGDTIRQLVKLLDGIPGARLVAVEISDAHFAGFFDRRLERLAAVVPNDTLRAGFQEWAGEMHRKAVAAGGMEIPYYRLEARKGRR